MPATNFAINNELNSEFRSGANASYPEGLPQNWYIGLSLSEITDDGEGVLEPTTGGYKRVAVPRTASYWTEPSSGSLVNSTTIEFPFSAEHWGTVQEVFISSSSSVGYSGSYIWFHSELETPMAILKGTKLTIPSNAILIDRKE